jgi:hypothetical protein
MTYYSGDVLTITGSFTNAAGTATDPTDLTVIITRHKATSGTTYQYNPGDITRTGTGAFSLSWTAPSVEALTMYEVQWLPTGAVQRASEPDRIYVAPILG